jgi:hypothetical protein
MTTLAGLALIFGAVICFVFGAKQLKDTKTKNASCSASATAQLLRYDEERAQKVDEDDGEVFEVTLHFPVFQYQAEGALREVRCGGAYDKSTWDVGASIPIRYDPKQPDHFVFDGDKNPNMLGYVVLAAGLACLVFGIAMLRG